MCVPQKTFPDNLKTSFTARLVQHIFMKMFPVMIDSII